jgi:hypothetical protein
MEEKEPTREFYENIKKLVEASAHLYRLADQEFAPMVDSIIQSKCTDLRRIDKLLDDLFSFACDDRILILFKRLCRYYYPINPEVVTYYVNAYREMWDNENVDSE